MRFLFLFLIFIFIKLNFIINVKIKDYCYECNAYELKTSNYESYAKVFTLYDVKFRILINL